MIRNLHHGFTEREALSTRLRALAAAQVGLLRRQRAAGRTSYSQLRDELNALCNILFIICGEHHAAAIRNAWTKDN